MSRTYSVYINPYKGLASSIVTSNVINMQDAFDWSYSWRTTSGTTSRVTVELSNANSIDSIQEKQWSEWTAFGGVAPQAMTLDGSLGTVVIGSKVGAGSPTGSAVIYSDYPYSGWIGTADGFPTGTAISALKWV